MTSAVTDIWASLPSAYRIPEQAPTLADAQAYCRELATTHYENFSVATWFLPERLRQHFYNVYAYCRISDDLGDETGNREHSLALLDLWEAELNATYLSLVERRPLEVRKPLEQIVAEAPVHNAATPRHPVFIALRETIRQFEIPRQPFADLLTAFRRDQTITRFPTFNDVLDYCKYSANPVGHLVLYLGGYSDAERQKLSDFTCTALQLANFWQDVRRDYDKGRIYLPQDSMARFGVSEADIAARRASPQFLELMRFEVARAREWFDQGLPLVKMVSPGIALDIELFSRGGQEILNAIERQGYDVLKSRPAISGPRKLWLVLRAAWKKVAL
jgi:squalene synthase HpnC